MGAAKTSKPSRWTLGPIDFNVANRIRERRIQIGFDTRLLDLAIGARPGTLDRIESGQRRVGASELFRIADTLEVGVQYFFETVSDEHADTRPEMAPPDPKIAQEARRFARAYYRLPHSPVRVTVRNLVKTLADQSERLSRDERKPD